MRAIHLELAGVALISGSSALRRRRKTTEPELPRVMSGLEPGIHAAPSVIIRGRQPWIHGSSPCMTESPDGKVNGPPPASPEQSAALRGCGKALELQVGGGRARYHCERGKPWNPISRGLAGCAALRSQQPGAGLDRGRRELLARSSEGVGLVGERYRSSAVEPPSVAVGHERDADVRGASVVAAADALHS